jgi:uncharacterized membrane protein YciS (DUF1049 family)
VSEFQAMHLLMVLYRQQIICTSTICIALKLRSRQVFIMTTDEVRAKDLQHNNLMNNINCATSGK